MLKPILRPILKSILQPVLIASTDLTRWVWTLNGMSYSEFPPAYLGPGSSVVIELDNIPANGEFLASDNKSTNGIYFDSAAGEVRVFYYVEGEGGGFLQLPIVVGSDATINFDIDANMIATLTINDASDSLSWSALNGNQSISRMGIRGTHVTPSVTVKSLAITNMLFDDFYTTRSCLFKLDEPYSESHIAVDSDNHDRVELVAVNPIVLDGSLPQFAGKTYSAVAPASSTQYRIQITNGCDGEVRFIYGGIQYFISSGASIDTVGNTGTSTSTERVIQDRVGGAVGEVYVSIKQTTAMQKFNDLPEDYREESV